ncbi:MAG: pyrimidine dimer DNA glycosylase/endonuclease V [bacterium]
MRLWSIHPKYLDPKGLVALWRESLLAKKVLEGKTKGYTKHPQLERFKNCIDPLGAINKYLSEVYSEAVKRQYNFDQKKIDWSYNRDLLITVSSEQIKYEFQHLVNKLETRDRERIVNFLSETEITANPLFIIVKGEIESWEIVKK